MAKYGGLNSVTKKELQAAKDWVSSYDSSINSYEWNGETFMNPHSLTQQELERVGLYMAGTRFFSNSKQAYLNEAYEKYQAARNWYAETQQKYADTDFNSSTEAIPREVEAMHDVGLNPDLLGLSGDAAASGHPVDADPLESSVPGSSGDVSQIVGMVGTVLQTASSLAGLVGQGLQIGQILRNNRAEYAGHILNDVLPSLIGTFPEEAFKDDSSFQSYFNEDSIRGLGFSSRDYQTMSSFLGRLKVSPSNLRNLFQNKSEYESFRQAYGSIAVSPLRYDPTDPNSLLNKLGALESDRLLWENRASIAASQYAAAYDTARNPELAAEGFDSQNTQILTQEKLLDLQYRQQVALMGCVIPRLEYAKSLIETGDPYYTAMGQTILADIQSPSNSLWSLVARFGGGFLDQIDRSLNGSPDGSGPVNVNPADPDGSYVNSDGVVIPRSGRFFREVVKACKDISDGRDPSFYGIKWSDVTGFFHDIDKGFAVGASSFWNAVKNGIDTSAPSSSPGPNMADSYDWFYGR